MTVKTAELIKSFRRNLKDKNRSDNTIVQYISIVTTLFSGSESNAHKITEAEISTFIRSKKSVRTRNQYIGALKTFFGFIGRPNVVNVPYGKPPKTLPKTISRVEFDARMKNVSNTKHRLIFLLMFSHGMRVGEVVNIRVSWFGSQVVEEKKYYTLQITGKGAKDRQIVLSKETAAELKSYAKEYSIDLTMKDQTLFKGQKSEHYSTSSIQALTKRFFNCKPHTLRHSCATELLNKGIDTKLVQEILGHESSQTTEIYQHVSVRTIIHIAA